MKKTETFLRSNSTVGILALAAILIAVSWAAAQDAGPRRSSFNDNWQFQKGDPAGSESALAWDTIKDWVAATGNEYVVDGAKPNRPAGELGENVTYAQRNFDETSWRKFNLPDAWGTVGAR